MIIAHRLMFVIIAISFFVFGLLNAGRTELLAEQKIETFIIHQPPIVLTNINVKHSEL